MATLIVKHRVANFETWKQNFDGMAEARARHGWISHRVVRDATDPNLVTVISKVKTLDGAKKYGTSDELRTAMASAGLVGAPEISFAEDAFEHTY
jgi:hypothetical protein